MIDKALTAEGAEVFAEVAEEWSLLCTLSS